MMRSNILTPSSFGVAPPDYKASCTFGRGAALRRPDIGSAMSLPLSWMSGSRRAVLDEVSVLGETWASVWVSAYQ